MKSIVFILCLVHGGGISACQNVQKTETHLPTRSAAEEFKADSIIRDTVINNQGVKLVMAYDNARHRATFVLAGKVITLRQDTTASGIRYSNPLYEYTEHQGQLTLKKGGKLIFSKP